MKFVARIFICLSGFAWAFCAHAKVLVVTEELAPLQVVEDGRVVDGIAYQKVKQLIDMANLETEWLVAPWSRAYRIAQTQPNVLLFSIVRTPAREDRFVWIAPTFLMELYLVSLHEANIVTDSLQAAKKQMIGVKRNDVFFEYLVENQFSSRTNLMVLRDTDDTFEALLKKRVDLIPANSIIIDAYCASRGCKLNDFRINLHLPEIQQDFYLVASLGTDPEVIKALQQAYIKLKVDVTPPQVQP